MSRTAFTGLFLSLLLAATGCSSSREAARGGEGGFVSVQGREIVDAEGKPLMLRGINLGNWLVPEGYMFKFERTAAPWQIRQLVAELVGPAEARAFWRQWYDRYITRDDIRYIRQAGFNSIRVPFNYKLFVVEDHPGLENPIGFELLDRVIGWSREEGLYVVLDMHAAPCGQTGENIDDSIGYPWLFESEECQAETAALWQRIARRYRDDRTVIGYDLLNEPIPHYPEYQRLNERLEPVYRRITKAVREVDPNHLLFLGGAQWDSNFKVFGPPFDGKLVYTFHKYWTAPTEEVIQEYLAFRDQYEVPLWMGESGENKDEWIATFTETLEKHRIGWCYWPYKKMDAPSSPRTFDRPPYWDEIVAYEKLFGATFEEKRKARPSLDHSRQALQGLLEQIVFSRSRENEGYLRALGLRATAEGAPAGGR